MKPIHAPTIPFLNMHLIVYFRLHLDLPSGTFPVRFRNKTSLPSHARHVLRSPHPRLCNHVKDTRTWRGVQVKKRLFMSFPPAPQYFHPPEV